MPRPSRNSMTFACFRYHSFSFLTASSLSGPVFCFSLLFMYVNAAISKPICPNFGMTV